MGPESLVLLKKNYHYIRGFLKDPRVRVPKPYDPPPSRAEDTPWRNALSGPARCMGLLFGEGRWAFQRAV